MIRRERATQPEQTNGSIDDRIPHTKERDLPGGANFVVQKFGGTSVGKFAVKIAEDIVLYVYLVQMKKCRGVGILNTTGQALSTSA